MDYIEPLPNNTRNLPTTGNNVPVTPTTLSPGDIRNLLVRRDLTTLRSTTGNTTFSTNSTNFGGGIPNSGNSNNSWLGSIMGNLGNIIGFGQPSSNQGSFDPMGWLTGTIGQSNSPGFMQGLFNPTGSGTSFFGNLLGSPGSGNSIMDSIFGPGGLFSQIFTGGGSQNPENTGTMLPGNYPGNYSGGPSGTGSPGWGPDGSWNPDDGTSGTTGTNSDQDPGPTSLDADTKKDVKQKLKDDGIGKKVIKKTLKEIDRILKDPNITSVHCKWEEIGNLLTNKGVSDGAKDEILNLIFPNFVLDPPTPLPPPPDFPPPGFPWWQDPGFPWQGGQGFPGQGGPDFPWQGGQGFPGQDPGFPWWLVGSSGQNQGFPGQGPGFPQLPWQGGPNDPYLPLSFFPDGNSAGSNFQLPGSSQGGLPSDIDLPPELTGFIGFSGTTAGTTGTGIPNSSSGNSSSTIGDFFNNNGGLFRAITAGHPSGSLITGTGGGTSHGEVGPAPNTGTTGSTDNPLSTTSSLPTGGIVASDTPTTGGTPPPVTTTPPSGTVSYHDANGNIIWVRQNDSPPPGYTEAFFLSEPNTPPHRVETYHNATGNQIWVEVGSQPPSGYTRGALSIGTTPPSVRLHNPDDPRTAPANELLNAVVNYTEGNNDVFNKFLPFRNSIKDNPALVARYDRAVEYIRRHIKFQVIDPNGEIVTPETPDAPDEFRNISGLVPGGEYYAAAAIFDAYHGNPSLIQRVLNRPGGTPFYLDLGNPERGIIGEYRSDNTFFAGVDDYFMFGNADPHDQLNVQAHEFAHAFDAKWDPTSRQYITDGLLDDWNNMYVGGALGGVSLKDLYTYARSASFARHNDYINSLPEDQRNNPPTDIDPTTGFRHYTYTNNEEAFASFFETFENPDQFLKTSENVILYYVLSKTLRSDPLNLRPIFRAYGLG